MNQRFKGVVTRGRQLGKELGVPTANIFLGSEALTNHGGVYRSWVWIGSRRYDAISNVGKNPTVGGHTRVLESHIFNFEGDIYGEVIEVELLDFIREERKFESVEELRRSINDDIKKVKQIINNGIATKIK